MMVAAGPHEIIWRRRVWALVPPVVVLITAAALWLMVVYGMRIKELQYRLRTNNDQKQSVRTLSLVSRYQLLRQKAGERDHALNYGREGRLMQALQHTSASENSPELGPAEATALWTIEFFNLIAASPRFRYEQSSPLFRALELAFYHELRRSYKEAIEIYTALLAVEKNLETDWRAYALLHRGFCRALAGERSAAQHDFENVIKTHATGEYHLTARALNAMVTEIDSELVKVALMAPSADKGAAFYRLTAYDQAISTFKGLGNLNANPAALFYLGRSHEESGGTGQAAEYYRKIIARHSKTVWAVRANRRLFAMGAFYTAGQEFRHESKNNVEKKIVDDQGLIKEAARFEKVAVHLETLESHKTTKVALNTGQQAMKNDPEVMRIAQKEKAIAKQEAEPQKRKPKSDSEVKADRVVSAANGEPGQGSKAKAPLAEKTQPTAIERAKTWQQKEALSRKDKSTYLKSQKSLTRIVMQDGNQFTGVVIKDSLTEIFLFTVMGKISIDKTQVASRERIRQ
jgi:tetratricopeptide (TPR) repeat protein